jgi:nucleoside-diphosphate-sugar epimerase
MLADGWQVTATDLPTSENRRIFSRHRRVRRLAARWADLTNEQEVAALVRDIRPDVVVHLAAVIPPTCYAAPQVARAVNVDSVRLLVDAAARAARPPRFVLASSMAVYGARNPHRDLGLLTPETPVAPSDNYGQHKAQAEAIVRDSGLDFVILRLGGVLTVNPRTAGGSELLQFSALLPADGRLQTIDVRDVATAFATAAREPVTGETFLIGGDDSHRRIQGDFGGEMVAAMGLEGALPAGRPGDPEDDTAWFVTDWMDTTTAQARLRFQHHSWQDMIAEIRSRAGLKRYLLRLVAPIIHARLERGSPYRDAPGTYADVWGGVRAAWGDPSPDAGA